MPARFVSNTMQAASRLPLKDSSLEGEQPSRSLDRPRVLIIGSGLAGLVAGYELAERGLSVTIIEAAHFPGGRTTSWFDKRGRILDTGAHVVADHYVNLLDVLDRIGVKHRLVWFRDQLYLRKGHAPIIWRLNQAPPPLHMFRMATRLRGSLPMRLRLAIAAFDLASYPESALQRLDLLSYGGWHRRHLGNSFMEVGDAAAEAACFLPANEASAYIVFSWIRAMSRNGRASDLASWDGPFHEALIAPLTRAIEDRGGKIRVQTAAVRIEHDDRRVLAVMTRPTTCTGPFHRSDGKVPLHYDQPEERVECDYFISAIPVQALQAIITPEFVKSASLTEALSLTTVPAIGVTVWFDRPISEIPSCTPLCSGVAMRGFMDFASVRRTQPGEPAVYQYVLNGARERIDLADEQIIREVINDFRQVWPAAREAQVIDYAVERVGAAMHASVPGAYAKRPAAATRLGNLFIAGDWTKHEPKPSMEGAVISGRCAADALLRSAGQPGINILRPAEGSFTSAVRHVRQMFLPRYR